MVGQMVVMVLYGMVIGVFLGGWLVECFGWKISLFWIGVFYLIFVVGLALAFDVYSFMFFCFIGGFGVGVFFVVVFMYIIEVAFKEQCGWLVVFF